MSLRRADRNPRLGGLGARPLWVLLRALLAAAALSACASEPKHGVMHVVQPGETVWRIARRYGVSSETVIRANGIRDVTRVRAGARLWIPGAREVLRTEPPRPPAEPVRTHPTGCFQAERKAGLSFAWPLRGTLTSRFGRRGRSRHDGVDLSAPRGTPVRAAEAGRVIHSGAGLGDYGKVVIVKHPGQWASVYAHNRRNLVKKGAFVEKGQLIAEVGTSGNATGPHLHFEIRHAGASRDPLPCLP